MGFIEVYPNEYNQELELSTVFCLRCLPADGCNAIKFCVKNDSLNNFSHLKRVRKSESHLEVIIGETENISDELSLFMKKCGDSTVYPVEVPMKSPFTKEQAALWSKIWPLNFRKPNWDPLYLNKENEKCYEELIKKAIYIGQEGLNSGAGCGSGCVILDGKGREVACAFDERKKHPLHHAVFQAINQFSQAILKEQGIAASIGRLSDCPLDDEGDCKANAPDTKRQKFSVEDIPCKPIETVDFTDLRPRNIDDQYLCQDAKVFLSHEPCIMCAMALVHSRVGLVVYKQKFDSWGGLGSFAKLHTSSSLNHRFHALVYFDEQHKEA